MASVSGSGSCYCELNPEDDYTCDSYTDSSGYTTYKMVKKETMAQMKKVGSLP